MQTFLPYPDFYKSALCLDRARLGKQRVEAWQILRILRGDSAGWANHPAVKMWKGHIAALCDYGRAICDEWIKRGYRDSMRPRFDLAGNGIRPAWIGDSEFHKAHRSNLLRKDPSWYGKFKWKENPDLPYIWPVV